jgi:hypothetical protein
MALLSAVLGVYHPCFKDLNDLLTEDGDGIIATADIGCLDHTRDVIGGDDSQDEPQEAVKPLEAAASDVEGHFGGHWCKFRETKLLVSARTRHVFEEDTELTPAHAMLISSRQSGSVNTVFKAPSKWYLATGGVDRIVSSEKVAAVQCKRRDNDDGDTFYVTELGPCHAIFDLDGKLMSDESRSTAENGKEQFDESFEILSKTDDILATDDEGSGEEVAALLRVSDISDNGDVEKVTPSANPGTDLDANLQAEDKEDANVEFGSEEEYSENDSGFLGHYGGHPCTFRETSLRNASRWRHVYEASAFTSAGAACISARRMGPRVNTVFLAPSKWYLASDVGRIISSEKVRTLHCWRSKGGKFKAKEIGLAFAIFNLSGHLLMEEFMATLEEY